MQNAAKRVPYRRYWGTATVPFCGLPPPGLLLRIASFFFCPSSGVRFDAGAIQNEFFQCLDKSLDLGRSLTDD